VSEYQWSNAAETAIELIIHELSKKYDFKVTVEQAVEVATKHYVRSITETKLRNASKSSDTDKRPLPELPVGYNGFYDYQSRNDLLRRVDELTWSSITYNILENAGIEYIWQLVEMTPHKMLRLKNCGRKSISEVFDRLAELELTLGMKLHPTDKFLVSNESVDERRWKKPLDYSYKGQEGGDDNA